MGFLAVVAGDLVLAAAYVDGNLSHMHPNGLILYRRREALDGRIETRSYPPGCLLQGAVSPAYFVKLFLKGFALAHAAGRGRAGLQAH